MIKKILILLLLSSFSFSAEKVKVLADENYSPYSYVDKGVLKGIYVDIIKAIDKNLTDYEIVLEPIPWTRGLKMIESGEAYALIPPYFRPKERPYMYWSSPILEEKLVVVGKNGENKTWPKDFAKKKIGINRGFSIFKEEDKKNIIIEEANATEDNILKLQFGK